ncbi:hypothetical protein X824_gp167 [Escherichia phage 4MG]|uniref:Hyphothetical protein n=1 Tax=Escherichia phage 4MG TaxID=1391428 RepID=V5KSQ6_9CAUD|nr:hypothetical protein X824_gp167 [Escherichia phage 4MG]AGZ17656.1 hyphothetical protein [Escherichia phage 4MG]
MKRGVTFEKAVALVEDTLSKTGAGKYINEYVVKIMEITYDMGFKAGAKTLEKERK